jgi:uncharacterized membrane protein
MTNSFDSFDINYFNSLITSASEAITCNSECQKQKKADTLKQKYLDSKINLLTAPNQVDVAEKNYVTFTKGELAYNEQQQAELSNKAQIITNKFKANFDAESKQVQSQIETYNSLLTNYENVTDLLVKYKTDNGKLFTKLRTETNDVLTNERKTYYEYQNIDNLKGYYSYVLIVIYIVFVVAFGFFALTYPSVVGAWYKILIFIAFLLLPFVSTWLLSTIIYLFHIMYDLLPKNVYLRP